MLITYDEAIEMIDKGWFDSMLIVTSSIGTHVIEEKCLPLHFVPYLLGEELCVKEIIDYVDNLRNGYDQLKIKLFLKEGKRHDKCEVQTVLLKDQIIQVKEALNIPIMAMTIKACFREMLHSLVD